MSFVAKYGAGAISFVIALPLIFWIGATYGLVAEVVTAMVCVIAGYGFGLWWGRRFREYN